MKVVTLLNEKGGCGKSTLASNIGGGLAMRGYNVLLIDADPQYDLTIAMGFRDEPDFYDLCVRGEDWRNILHEVPAHHFRPDASDGGRLFIVLGNVETEGIAARIRENPAIIRQRVKQLADRIDFVIFDTSPTPSPLHPAIVLATDYIIAPTDCERFGALNGLPNSIAHTETFSDAAQAHGIVSGRVMGIVPNKYRQTVIHDRIIKQLKQDYGALVWSPLGQYIAYADAQLESKTIFAHAPESEAAHQMLAIVKRVEQLAGQPHEQQT